MSLEQQQLSQFIQKVKPILSRITYPIRDFEQLGESMGGKQASFEWEGREIKVEQARRLLPDYLFPIDSEEDLVAIAVNIELLRPGNQLVPNQVGQESEPTPDRTPPAGLLNDGGFSEKIKSIRDVSSVVKGYRLGETSR